MARLCWKLVTLFECGCTVAVSWEIQYGTAELTHASYRWEQVPLDKIGEQAGLVRPRGDR